MVVVVVVVVVALALVALVVALAVALAVVVVVVVVVLAVSVAVCLGSTPALAGLIEITRPPLFGSQTLLRMQCEMSVLPCCKLVWVPEQKIQNKN